MDVTRRAIPMFLEFIMKVLFLLNVKGVTSIFHTFFDSRFNPVEVFGVQFEILVLFDFKIRDQQVMGGLDIFIVENGLDTPDGAAVDDHEIFHVPGRLDKAAESASDPRKAEHPAQSFLG
jgi:hypothetical protein